MTDGLNLLNNEPTGISRRPSGYSASSVREVQARASSVDQEQTEQERRGLRRLNSVLSGDRPLRDNVPRGFYLNIEI